MNTEYESPNVGALAARWWALVVRGVAAMLFGVLAFVAPAISLLALVVIWSAYALVDGLFSLVSAARGASAGRRWGWLVFAGVVSVIAGGLTFAWPRITALALLTVIALWAVLTGVAEIAAALRLRRQIGGEWLLAASGILSIGFGALMLLFPSSGALALVWMIGSYALLFGALLIGLGLRLHRWDQSHAPPMSMGGSATAT